MLPWDSGRTNLFNLHFADLILVTLVSPARHDNVIPIISHSNLFTKRSNWTHSRTMDDMTKRTIMMSSNSPAPAPIPATAGRGRPAKKETTLSIMSSTGFPEGVSGRPDPDPLPVIILLCSNNIYCYTINGCLVILLTCHWDFALLQLWHQNHCRYGNGRQLQATLQDKRRAFHYFADVGKVWKRRCRHWLQAMAAGLAGRLLTDLLHTAPLKGDKEVRL